MISLVLVMTVVNFCIILTYNIRQKFKNIRAKRQNKVANNLDPVVEVTVSQAQTHSIASGITNARMILGETTKAKHQRRMLF